MAPRRTLRVGMIADTFTALAFRYEWDGVALHPDTFREEIASLDMLFVESAWHGNDDAWQYQLTGSKAPSQALRDLVAQCRTLGIPTVFWNKEDPVHFADFLDTARLFDWVFTTEGECIENYREELGHDRVGLLPFAAQPAIHNPMGRPAANEIRDIAFAGTYFAHKYPERREQMDMLLGGAMDVHEKYRASLDIFARFQGMDPNYSYPPPLDGFVRGELSYRQVLSAYRSYRTFINVNSIPNSQTMCARRIFEITACGAVVVSSQTPAIDIYLGDAVVESRDRSESAAVFRALLRSPELRERLVYQGQMAIWERHTYSHRADQVLTAVGLTDHVLGQPRVSVLVSTNRPHQVGHVLNQLACQRGVEIQPLILTHGFVPDPSDVAFAKRLDVEWVAGEAEWTLGACYNELLSRARFPISAKFDDDDEYGPFYLLEQSMAMVYTGADVVGKQSHFTRLESNTQNYLAVRTPGFEHCTTHFVSGPTLVFDTDFVREIGFEDRSQGEDTALLKAVLDAGGTIWSTSKYGFIQNRKRSAHTWRVRNADILANAEVVSGDYTGV
ncbi:MAG: glycosyltransferase [Ancrocorticia sp.]